MTPPSEELEESPMPGRFIHGSVERVVPHVAMSAIHANTPPSLPTGMDATWVPLETLKKRTSPMAEAASARSAFSGLMMIGKSWP